jgi:hypothetical protein
MPVTRTTLLSGPAAATFNGHTFFARDGILVTPALELDAVDSDAQGVLDATVTGAPVTIKFSPSAPFADLIALYPYTLGTPGMSLFGSADTPLVLVAANGVRLTFSAVAIIQMPDLTLSSSGTAAGAVTFLALGARSLPITAANRLVTIDTAEFPALPTTPPQLADDFEITWSGAGSTGSSSWLNLRARDGVKVHFAMKTSPVVSAANALLDLTLDSLAVEARFTPGTPGGPAEADVFEALQVQGALPGRLLSTGAQTLDVAGEHLWLQLPLAQLTQGPLTFDAVHARVGELVFTAGRALLGAESEPEALVTLTEGEP